MNSKSAGLYLRRSCVISTPFPVLGQVVGRAADLRFDPQ